MRTSSRLSLILSPLIALAAMTAYAGDLVAPHGAPSSTMKTLSQVEPRTIIDSIPFHITEDGSYYLTQNLYGVEGEHGIIVAADNVTIDLAGYSLIGVPNSLRGITREAVQQPEDGRGAGPSSGQTAVVIMNGIVRDWGIEGIRFDGYDSVRVSNTTVLNNRRDGIYLGNGCIVENCIGRLNNKEGNGAGIHVGEGSVVRDCTTSDNSAEVSGGSCGISAGGGCVIVDNTAFGQCGGPTNGSADGIIVLGNNSLIRGNNCYGNKGFGSGYGRGISCIGGRHSISNNVCHDNTVWGDGATASGIYATDGNWIDGNTCTNNTANGFDGSAFGILCFKTNVVTGNSVSGNNGSGSGISAGISVGSRSRVSGNHSSNHQNQGQIVTRIPGGFGIRVTASSVTGVSVTDNSTSNNETAGIVFENTDQGTNNYHARNTLNEFIGVINLGAPNSEGTGDNANVIF
jgi:hypothetical protein